MLSFSAVKLVNSPLRFTDKVKVKSSPLIVKFICNSFKDSPVDVRVVIYFRVAGARLKPNRRAFLGRSLFAPEEDGNQLLSNRKTMCHLCATPFGAKCPISTTS